MNSRLGMVYGAAGTGKTRVAEYIAKIFENKNILLLANTNAAKNNLERRINASCDCYTVYDYFLLCNIINFIDKFVFIYKHIRITFNAF